MTATESSDVIAHTLEQIQQLAAGIRERNKAIDLAARVRRDMTQLSAAAAATHSLPDVGVDVVLSRIADAGTQTIIDTMASRTDLVFMSALEDAGLNETVVSLLGAWMGVSTQEALLRQHVKVDALVAALSSSDPSAGTAMPRAHTPKLAPAIEWWSAGELGQVVGVSAKTVREQEDQGKWFSILHEKRQRGRMYPSFQSWPEIRGRTLITILEALGADAKTQAYGFFTSRSEFLAQLSPLSVLSGRSRSATVSPAQEYVLQLPPEERHRLVLDAARHYA